MVIEELREEEKKGSVAEKVGLTGVAAQSVSKDEEGKVYIEKEKVTVRAEEAFDEDEDIVVVKPGRVKPLKIPVFIKKRRKVTQEFIDEEELKSDGASKTSDAFDCQDFSKFLLYLQIIKEGDPADSTVQIKVKFSDAEDGVYHDYQNGPFGYMIWEEDAIPVGGDGLMVCTSGDCIGKYMKVEVIAAVGTTLNSTNYFRVTVKADFMV